MWVTVLVVGTGASGLPIIVFQLYTVVTVMLSYVKLCIGPPL